MILIFEMTVPSTRHYPCYGLFRGYGRSHIDGQLAHHDSMKARTISVAKTM